jgi:hypothetical protein
VLLDGDGRPVCSEMWQGNTADVTTLIPVIDRHFQFLAKRRSEFPCPNPPARTLARLPPMRSKMRCRKLSQFAAATPLRLRITLIANAFLEAEVDRSDRRNRAERNC